jgi:hypothetical protein
MSETRSPGKSPADSVPNGSLLPDALKADLAIQGAVDKTTEEAFNLLKSEGDTVGATMTHAQIAAVTKLVESVKGDWYSEACRRIRHAIDKEVGR